MYRLTRQSWGSDVGLQNPRLRMASVQCLSGGMTQMLTGQQGGKAWDLERRCRRGCRETRAASEKTLRQLPWAP